MACPLYKDFCPDHNFVHGAEAEELRKGVERIINSIDGDERYYGDELVGRFQTLLDRVDARDSLAYREAQDKDEET